MTEPAELRLFVAFTLPEPVKDQLSQAQAELRRVFPEGVVRWAPRKQFHLTLKFLGNVDAANLDPLIEALRIAACPFGPLRLRAEQLGFFPQARWPRVIWAGVRDAQQQLGLLQAAVQRATDAFTSEQPEGAFIGHVTLARVQQPGRIDSLRLVDVANNFSNRCFGEWTANELGLLRSELSPTGARHTTVAFTPLGGSTESLS